ncbi:hypothetical protein O181_066653 [Austropuccinia psidii MF-1]|uniref:Reverse transcriptase Ty1/copia-type domain-containing protein n=1 Tax=Austropuccinia psidii MF-1 TaxID=1389203 RepID=A0A9Q3ERU9_9BASI|nr:hypothetical protein [Austropuccinia psidii MF-1]
MIHSASAIFRPFQTDHLTQQTLDKGSLRHVISTMSLGQVPTELYFERKEKAISSLPLAKDMSIPENLKQALSGNIKKFKARLVAPGNQQCPGIDCTETYAPTASLMSLRLLLETACLQHWNVCSLDVTGAYLYRPVEETVLMEPHTHFLPSLNRKALHLKKALYGMKQACRSSNSPTEVENFHDALCNNFEIKLSDAMKRIVGLECTFSEGKVAILQSRLTNNILNAYPRKIFQHDCPLPPIPTMTSNDHEVIMDATPFRSVVGSLSYLVSGSRLDLAFAVNYLARHSTSPTATHWTILDHLVGYLLKTRGHGIVLHLW